MSVGAASAAASNAGPATVARPSRAKLWAGLLVTVSLTFTGIFGPALAPYDAEARDAGAIMADPSSAHWLGTDEEGRDLLSLLINGARVALLVGLGTVLLSGILGTGLGLLSGYVGGMTDLVLQRCIEVILSFPGILLAILIIFVTGSPGVASVVFALAATGWSGYARLVRGQVLSLRERGFVEATRILGLSTPRILARHLLPSVAGPVGVLMTFQVASAILAEAGLSFLGLGPQDGSSWGGMLEQGAILFVQSPLIGMSAGLAIAVTVIGVNFLGDYLRDVLDPQSKG